MLARTLGVERLVVLINKMDDPTVKWAEARYKQCVDKLAPFLKGCGFSPKSISFVPCSGITGANLIEKSSKEVGVPSFCSAEFAF
jgi:peptide chain release factor subunit 3